MPNPSKPKATAAKPAGAARAKPAAPAGARSRGKPAADSVAQSVAEAVAAPSPEAAVPPGEGGVQSLRMKEFVDAVAERTGGKKAEVKPVLEAALAVLGAALARGEGVNLPGFGKSKIAKTKAAGAGTVLTLKLKQSAEKNAKFPLAEADE